MIKYRFDLRKGDYHAQMYLLVEKEIELDKFDETIERFRPKFRDSLYPECSASDITLTFVDRNCQSP